MTHFLKIIGRKAVVFLIAGMLALSLSACGSGDDSSGDSANNTPTEQDGGSNNQDPPENQSRLSLNQGNAKKVAKATLSATQQKAETSFPGAGGNSGPASARRATTDGERIDPGAIDFQLCDSGEFSITNNGSDGDHKIVYSSCTITSGTHSVTYDGSVTTETTVVDENDPKQNDDWKRRRTYTCDLEMSINGRSRSCHGTYSYIIGFSAKGQSDGELYYTIRDRTYTVNGINVDVEWRSSDDAYYTTGDYDDDGVRGFRLNGTFRYGNSGSVTVTTDVPFEVGSNGNLAQGQIVIKGANDSKLVISAAEDGALRLQLDANGDGDYADEGDIDKTFDYESFVPAEDDAR